MIVYISTYLIWMTSVLLLNQNKQIVFRIYPLSFVMFGWSTFVWYLIYTFAVFLTLVRVFLLGKHAAHVSHIYSTVGIALTLLPLCFVKSSLILQYRRRDTELYRTALTQLSSGGYVQAIHHYVFHSHNIQGIVYHFKGDHIQYPFQFDIVLRCDPSSITLRGVAKSLDCLSITSVTGSGQFSCLNGCQGLDVRYSECEEKLYLVTQ